MSKKTSLVTRRAWRLVRLVLLWARKGGLFRNRLAVNFNILQKVIKKLVHSNESHRGLVYGDHEFSFECTPIVHVKMHRPATTLRFHLPHIPCIKPRVNFDYDDEDDMSVDEAMWSSDECMQAQSTCTSGEGEEECDEGIDERAEEFIAKFYEQMKLQRQISYNLECS